MACAHGLGIELEALEGARAHVGDQHVGRGEQAVEHGVVVEVAQVEHHRALAPVVDLERRYG